MLIFWRIRYLDRSEKTFKNRDLFLDTATLPPAKRAAVELLAESKNRNNEREFLKFKSLFINDTEAKPRSEKIKSHGKVKMFSLADYFEDETGNELTEHEMGAIITGNPNSVFVPAGTTQVDLDYMFAEKKPIPVADVMLTSDEVRLFGYFVRDLREVQISAFMKDGAGAISSGGYLSELPIGDFYHETAVTDDEIRSFVTIFRRLYMEKEPANFLKAARLFEKCLGDHALGKWIAGIASEYVLHLQSSPDYRPVTRGTTLNFNVKRLIDVFLYTQYAHQPDDRRQRQFNQCLEQTGGNSNFLTWLFLTELWKCGLEICSAGRPINAWFNQYCEHHGVIPDTLNSLCIEHGGLGKAEKDYDRKSRLSREKVEELEIELWRNAGKPEGGPVQYRHKAQEQLRRALDGEDVCEEDNSG